MRKTLIIFILPLITLWSPAMAEIGADEILRQLPSPDVNYVLPEIKAVKPPVALPEYSAVEHYGHPKPPKKEFEHSLNEIKAIFDVPVVTSTIKLISDLADGREKEQVANSEKSSGATELKRSRQFYQPAGANQKASDQQTSQSTRVAIPPPIEIARPSHPPPTGKLLEAWQTLRKNPALSELEESLHRDQQLAQDTAEMAMQLATKKQKPVKDKTDDEVGEIDEEKAVAGSHDAILAKAMGLYKKKDWKGLKTLFTDNPEAGETPDGLRYTIEAEINETSPNYMQIRRYSSQLIQIIKDDPMANYGMALYYFNAKKPNTTKAQEHIATTLKAKNPPEGASAFYWKMTFKKFMIPLLILIAALIGGISQVIKKRKAAATLDLDLLAEPTTPDAEAKAKGKLMQKLSPVLDKLKGILARFKKKPATPATVATPTPDTAADAEETGEIAEETAEADEKEETEKASEDESE